MAYTQRKGLSAKKQEGGFNEYSCMHETGA